MSDHQVLVVRDRELLLEAVTARLVTRLLELQSAREKASLLISGDVFIHELVSAMAERPERDVVAWDRLEVWWSNTNWARPGLDEQLADEFDDLKVAPENLHPIRSRKQSGRAMDAVAEYASQLAAAMRPGEPAPIPPIDIALLSIGPDGSVAGLHPGQPTLHDNSPISVDTHQRQITLTLPALNAATEVWLIGSGVDVAEAVGQTLAGADTSRIPAAGVRGSHHTVVLLDQGAASRIPR